MPFSVIFSRKICFSNIIIKNKSLKTYIKHILLLYVILLNIPSVLFYYSVIYFEHLPSGSPAPDIMDSDASAEFTFSWENLRVNEQIDISHAYLSFIYFRKCTLKSLPSLLFEVYIEKQNSYRKVYIIHGIAINFYTLNTWM